MVAMFTAYRIVRVGVALLLGVVLYNGPAQALDYVAPTRHVNFQIVGATLMETPYCDEKRPYIHLSIDQAGQSGRSVRLSVPHSDAGKGGITGWSALPPHFPICAITGTHYEDFLQAGPQFAGEDVMSCADGTANFRVQMYDQDDGADDLHLDHSFTVNVDDPDDPLLEGCHDAGDNGKVCWRITVTQSDDTSRDSDGDGLVDFEETYGADRDCDGQLVFGDDLFLPEMGVDPSHKDMLVEMNWFTGFVPALADLEAVQYIFGEAPVSAGGVNNPDGEPGVNLIIDAGPVLNNVALHEAGGRDLGTSAESPTSSEELEALVAQIELPSRVGYFRNIVFGPLFSDGMPMSGVAGRSVGNDRIQIQDGGSGTIFHELGHSLGLLHGGEGRMGDSSWPAFTLIDADGDGNIDEADLDEDDINEARAADINGDGVWDAWALDEDGDGTFDSLDRFFAGQNCKPNHLSTMNYIYGPGISYETGGVLSYFDDFSPSKISDALLPTSTSCPSDNPTCNRRIPLMPDLLEYQLDESTALVKSVVSDGLVYRHTIRHFDPTGKFVQGTFVDVAQDWDNNPMTTHAAPTFLAGNIDMDASASNVPGSQTCGAINNAELQRLVNHDEWSKIVLPPIRGVTAESQGSNTYFEDRHPPLSRENREAWRAAAITCDLSVDAYLQPEYVSVGQAASFVVEVANLGPGPASDGSVSVELPVGVSAATVPAACSPQAGRPGRYDCSTALQGSYGLKALAAGQHIQFVFALAVAPNTSGGPRDILVHASHEGPEVNHEDNSVQVPLIASPAFLGFEDSARPWLRAWSGGQLAPTTVNQASQGTRSLASSCGTYQYESPSFDTAELELLGTKLGLDVFVPSVHTGSYVGELQLFVDIPSAGVNNQYVGRQDFAALTRNSWVAVSFTLGQNVLNKLKGDYPDARLRLQVNVSNCAAPVYVDRLRFEGTLSLRELWHPSDRLDVISSSVLSFDNAQDWAVAAGVGSLATETATRLQGTAAVAVGVQNWARVESREFYPEELQAISDLLAVDVHIPNLPADYYWLGQVNAFLSCPNVGLYNEYLGYQALQILFDDEFNQLTFPVTGRAGSVLGMAGARCRIAFEISSNQQYGSFVLDNGGFVQ